MQEVVYQGESFVAYVTLHDGTQVSMRGISQRDSLASLPSRGREVFLGLHREETVLIPDAGDEEAGA